MKNRLRKLIALVLAGAVLTGTAAALAAPETDTEDAGKAVSEEAMPEEEEAEASAPTPTPEPPADSAENDKWYQEAIGFLAYLGIFTGDEKGDMKPESPVTRAEIAAIILREMNISATVTYADTFEDVDSSHWAADVIQTAYDNGIINGYDDGTFGPDEPVTYEQAVKMVVCAVNYGDYAPIYGGYPNGYLKIAYDEGMADHVDGKIGEPLIRRNIAKLVYNSLTIPYPKLTGITGASLEYTKDENKTILSEMRNIYYDEGTITATKGMSMDYSFDISKNQIVFEGDLMDSEIENPNQYVARYIRLFYRDKDGKGNDKTALYAVPMPNKTEEITISADDIESIKTGYTGSGTPQLTYYTDTKRSKTRRLKLVEQPLVVYNDQPFTAANYASLDPKDADGNYLSFDEFITPEIGSVRAVDFSKDGTYDVLIVESYEVSVVKLVTALRLQLEYDVSFGSIIKLDTTEDTNLKVSVTRDGDEAELRNLQAGDVVSIKMNANFLDSSYTGSKYITIDSTIDYIDGKVSSANSDDDGYYVVIDGTEYEVVNEDVYSDAKAQIGTNGKYYLDKFGHIAWTDGTASGGLSSGEKYGWLVNVYQNDSGSDVMAKLYSQEGSMLTLKLADKVDYWAPDASDNVKTDAAQIDSLINNTAEGDKYFLTAAATDKNGSGVKGNVGIRLCKYKTNGSNEITRLFLAVDENSVSEKSGALRVSTTDHKTSHYSQGLYAGKYVLAEGTPQITVPLSLSENNDASNYGYRLAPLYEFSVTTGDKDVGYNLFFGDVKDSEPGIMVRMTKSTDETYDIEDYGTADDNPVMLLSGIGRGVDEDDEDIYIIKGYREGKQVQYNVSKNALVAQVATKAFDGSHNKYYQSNTIWTKDSEEDLANILHAGDICGIKADGSTANIILRMVDTKGLAEYITKGGEIGTVQDGQMKRDDMFSSTRDRVTFGYVTDVRTSPIVQYDIAVDGFTGTDEDGNITSDGGATVITMGVPDLNRAVQFVNISPSGKITVDSDLSDPYEVQEGDYIFMRNFRNDTAREMFVVRFE